VAIALVASTGKSVGINGGSLDAINTTGATAIIVGVGGFGTVTISDNKGNSYTPLTGYTQADSATFRFHYVLTPVVGSGHVITLSGSGIYCAATAYAFSGAINYDSRQNGASGTSSPLNAGSVTPSVNGALVITGTTAGGIAATFSTPSGFTGLIQVTGIGAVSVYAVGAYQIQTTAAAINPQWTWTGSTNVAAAVAVFAEIPGTAIARLSQLPVEVGILDSVPVSFRLSQLAIEVLINTSIVPPTVTEKTQFMIIMP